MPQKSSSARAIGRPRRACDRCNSQKIRCVGSPPSCLRCMRLRRTCSYGQLQGALSDAGYPARSPSSSTPARAANEESPVLPHSCSRADRCQAPHLEPQSLPLPAQATADVEARCRYCGVPQSLVWDLVDIYFTHAYNAALLLHKPTFMHSLRSGTVTPHVLLSVCAWASKFYQDESGSFTLIKPGFSNEWATRAGSLVYAELAEPREENIVTYINLALYWYSIGEWRKCFLLKWNATLISYGLGMSSYTNDATPTLSLELRRRRFWASHLIMSFGSRVDFSATDYSPVFEKVPLPCSESLFEAGVTGPTGQLPDAQRDGSIYAELVRVITLWNEVSDMARKPDIPRLAVLESLHEKLSRWWSRVPDDLKFPLDADAGSHTSGTPPQQPSKQPMRLLLLLRVMYHQSVCILHSSIVPLFSYRSDTEHLLYARQVSAQLAFEHAQIISRLLKAVPRYSINPNQIPSFVSYAAYTACAVQIPFFWCLNPDVQARVRSNVLANLCVIQQMGKHWKYIGLLGMNAWTLYKAHSRHPFHLDDEPKFMDPAKLNIYWNGTDRAARSILGYNEILWQPAGSSVARTDAEITDLGLNRSRPSSAPPDGAVSSLIDELSNSSTAVAGSFSGQNAAPASKNTTAISTSSNIADSLLTSVPRLDGTIPFIMPYSPVDGVDFLAQNDMISSQQLASFDTWLEQIESDMALSGDGVDVLHKSNEGDMRT